MAVSKSLQDAIRKSMVFAKQTGEAKTKVFEDVDLEKSNVLMLGLLPIIILMLFPIRLPAMRRSLPFTFTLTVTMKT